MKAIWKLFWDICLLKQGPEQVPASGPLFLVVILTFVLFNVLVRAFFLYSVFSEALLSSLLILLVIGGCLWAGLALKGGLNRYQQTATALLGQDIVITILSLPMLIMLVLEQQTGEVDPNSAILQIGTMMMFVFYGWDLAVKAFVLKRALDVGFGLGFMFAFTLVMGTLALETQLFGSVESGEQNTRTMIDESYTQ